MTSTASVDGFLLEAVAGRGREGVRWTLDLLDNGTPADDVIVDLLAVAQREVGSRWQRNEWSVADEHLATAVTQKSLDAVAGTVVPPTARGNVVVACAEGDWHSLPAQMFAERLYLRGFEVSFLGASTPVDHVEALLGRHQFDALAVSCNVPLFFDGVARLAVAAHRQGTPVIAGGRALGGDDRRAAHLGADAWAAGADGAAAVIERWRANPPTAFRVQSPAVDVLQERADAIAERAFSALFSAFPQMASYTTDQLSRTREDLVFIVQFARAAVMVDDATVFHEFIDWLGTLLSSRGVPSAALDEGLAALSPLLSDIDPRAGLLVEDARGRTGGSSARSEP
jgi:methanogenic corrinoid protein MtbC1